MSVVIRIDGDDYEALKQWAEPLMDKPKDVISKLIVHAIRTGFGPNKGEIDTEADALKTIVGQIYPPGHPAHEILKRY